MTSISPLHAKHIHFVGLKGVGMTALALCAKDLSVRVTGSDLEEVFVTDETLKKHGILWVTGFHPVNIEADVDLVITTGAHGGLNNPEVIAARDKGIPVLTHAEALGEFTRGKDLITVAGVGGKTTTASMVSTLLSVAGRHPSFAVGVGDIKVLGTPGRYDKEGREFVTEVNRVPKDGLLIACIDNANVRKLTKQTHVPVRTYGFSEGADYRIEKLEVGGGKLDFEVGSGRYTLKVPGRFNVLNATAAIVAGEFLGVTKPDLVKGIEAYAGCKRRIEKVGEVNGIAVWDDYAHHPTEIQAVLTALRDWYPGRRLVAVFQPHTYSRTKVLFEDFARSFEKTDKVIIMDIYASARETDTLSVDSEKLAAEVSKHHQNVVYTGTQEKTIKHLVSNAHNGDVIVTLGAGDIFHMHYKLLKRL
ncbi:MAG: UDP-N-acetylmuramate--L-alanine ligase [Candidatus Blackburnbacteria bacterium]|nr:UDP-N-acetylmuramate--L-alanine ligase [Candidatus Blackburnbacteria bacterium]